MCQILPHRHAWLTATSGGIIAGALMQHRAQETPPPVSNVAESLAVPRAFGPQSRLHAAAMGLTLRGDSRQVRQGMAPARVTPAPPHDLSALATVLGARGDPALRAPHLSIPCGQGLGGFGTPPGGDLATDPREGLHHRHSGWPPRLVRCLSPRLQQRLALLGATPQVLGQYAATGSQERTMGRRGCGSARGNG
jgi:hypothetical protein